MAIQEFGRVLKVGLLRAVGLRHSEETKGLSEVQQTALSELSNLVNNPSTLWEHGYSKLDGEPVRYLRTFTTEKGGIQYELFNFERDTQSSHIRHASLKITNDAGKVILSFGSRFPETFGGKPSDTAAELVKILYERGDHFGASMPKDFRKA